jgi:hypothetical protein
MLNSLDAVPLPYADTDDDDTLHLALSAVVLGTANDFVLKKLAGVGQPAPVVNFPLEDEDDVAPDDTDELARVQDRDRAILRFRGRLFFDLMQIRAEFARNAIEPKHTDSAHQQQLPDEATPLPTPLPTLLGVSPIAIPDPSSAPPSTPRGVDYVDTLPSSAA